MTEGPLSSTSDLIKKFKGFPKSRLAFITIKDNCQNSKWIQIGKINDWIRRYSTNYIIVKGTAGGIHFHLLAGLSPDRTLESLKPQKGIHFHIMGIEQTNKQPLTHSEIGEIIQCSELAQKIKEDTLEELTADALTPSQQQQLSNICSAIRLYYKRKADSRKRLEALTKKERSIERVLLYLEKNLEEPRSDEANQGQFHDYIVRLPL